MATPQHTRPIHPQERLLDERTPLLADEGPSRHTPRKQKKGSRSSSKRNSRSTEESEYAYSDVESLTRRAYSTSSGHSCQQSSSKQSHCGGSASIRSQSSSTTSARTCESLPKAALDGSLSLRADCHDRDQDLLHTSSLDVGRRDGASEEGVFSFFSAIFPAYDSVSLRLENSGSVARDHLASERTFLAYMRTSLAIASAGVALVQLFSAAAGSMPEGSTHRLHTYIRPLGASAIGMGIIVLIIGVVRYFAVQAALTKGYFPVSRIATGFIAMMLSVLVTVTFGILLSGKLEPRRK